MSSCKCSCIKCLWLSNDNENKQILISMCAGLIFFSGWWMFIDAAACYKEIMFTHKVYYVPGICGTIAMIVVNVTPYRTSENIALYETKCHPAVSLAILFTALVVSFGTVTWSFYILIADFLVPDDANVWVGLEIMLQNLCIITSNLMLKLTREQRSDL